MNSEDAELAHRVLVAIRQILLRVSSHSKAMSQQVGLTVPQLLCLKAVGRLEETVDEITVALVSKEVKLAPATVSRIVDRLVRAELLLRERGRADRRRVCLSLTPKGLERYQSLPIPLQEKFVQRFSALPEDERERLLDALKQIGQFMDAQDMDASPILTPGDVIKPAAN
ncbi:MAG: MarR family winged helix-turn-helix transcriptional regulator [Bradymonadia bacterium]